MPIRELADDSSGRAEQADAQEEQGERHGIGHAAERAGHHGVDDVADHAVEGPPLAGGDSDGQPDEEEADAVAAVLRLELAGAVPDLAHGAARDVRHAHPGAADRAQRQRQSPALGLAAGCRLAARGGLAVRGARGGTAARRGARGRGRTCRHGPHGTRKPRVTHASHALQDHLACATAICGSHRPNGGAAGPGVRPFPLVRRCGVGRPCHAGTASGGACAGDCEQRAGAGGLSSPRPPTTAHRPPPIGPGLGRRRRRSSSPPTAHAVASGRALRRTRASQMTGSPAACWRRGEADG